MKKRHLGHNVYCDFDKIVDSIVLTVELDGYKTPIQTIYLAEDVFRGLRCFVDDMNRGVDEDEEE